MKMFKGFSNAKLPRAVALLCALVAVFSFAGCETETDKKSGEETHTHVYSQEWKSDGSNHWRECECGDKLNVTAHTFGAWTEATEADCTTAGVKAHKDCTVCQKHFSSDGAVIADLEIPVNENHDYKSAWSSDATNHWHECNRNASHKKDSSAHDWNEGTITKPASEDESGIMTFECTICHKTKTESIPKLDHAHSYSADWKKDENVHWHECACGAKQDEVAHSFLFGECIVCHAPDPSYSSPDRTYAFPSNVNFGNNVYVHDPSVFKDPKDGKYYVFGSHFAVASSADLISWTQNAFDGGYQTLYGGRDWKTVLAQGFAHVPNCESTWAPDVEYYNGKYYMYVSLSSFASNTSAIVRVEADSVLGAYGNEQMIITSTQGVSVQNCIDPELFYDKDGGLWMVYGSFSDGIFIKELNNSGANWGLPKDSGIGTKLWQGISPQDAAQGGPEGPFIFYNEETDYYYLIVSDGSLSKNYQMRVARSKNPNGPYCDITGADMASAHGKGNKLAGNWQFSGEEGKAAYGHNSVCEINGEFFVFAHMRYSENGNVSTGHNVRVHRLLFNEQGWPVLASERYAGERLGKIAESEIAGGYDLILHSEGTSAAFVNSERYQFTANHQITKNGTNCGTWSYKASGNYIDITLNDVTYKGTAMPVWASGGGTISLSAVSDTGRSLWANCAVKKTNPNLDIVKQVDGAARNTSVAAFDAEDGFTLSFRATTGDSDWLAVALDVAGMRITLPNLDTAFNSAGFQTGNCFPYSAGANQNGYEYSCYLNTSCYVSISVSKTGGVRFYKNGVLTQEYESTDTINLIGEGQTAASVASFVEKLIDLISENGFTFTPASFVSSEGEAENSISAASDLIVSRGAADGAKALAIYNFYGTNE